MLDAMEHRIAELERTVNDLRRANGALVVRTAELERRMDSMIRPGKATDVDTEKQRVRLEIGNKDGQAVKSAWVPYVQHAGEFKFHNPPTVGQQMVVFAPNGEMRNAVAFPFTWTNDNPSPSSSADEKVASWDQFKLTLKKDSLKVELGDDCFAEITTQHVRGRKGDARFVASDKQAKIRKGGSWIFCDGEKVFSKPLPVLGDDNDPDL